MRYRMMGSGKGYTSEELDAAEDYQRRLTQHLARRGTFEDWRPEVQKAQAARWAEWVDLPTSFTAERHAFYWNQPYDSVAALSETAIPVLALYGGADFVVPAEVNVPKLRALLTEAGNEDFEISIHGPE